MSVGPYSLVTQNAGANTKFYNTKNTGIELTLGSLLEKNTNGI